LPEVRFFVVCSTLSFCSNTEHSQYRVSDVDVSPDFIRPKVDWKQESGKDREAWLQHLPHRNYAKLTRETVLKI
jgi:hypothetical protein